MIQVMMLVHFFATPLMVSALVPAPAWAAGLAFIATFALWSINFIGAELELPFGDDYNDLPVEEMQDDLNDSLRLLLLRDTRYPPTFVLQDHHVHCPVRRWE